MTRRGAKPARAAKARGAATAARAPVARAQSPAAKPRAQAKSASAKPLRAAPSPRAHAATPPARSAKPRVGVLAIQGDYEAHAQALARAGAEPELVLWPKQLAALDALVLPGGESTTIAKGLARLGLYAPLRARIRAGMPVLGTCAGAILLAKRVENRPVATLGVLDATAVRNAYGTQVDSFAAPLDGGADPALAGLRCVFIRAPRLKALGRGVEVLARVDGEPVLVREGRVLAATFHPELTDDARVHRALLEAIPPPQRA